MAGSEIQGEIDKRNVIAVPERGEVEVPWTVWKQMESVTSFRLLLDRGVLAASLLPGGSVRLRGSCYVGRAQCGDMVLEIQEKINGALVSLLRHATHEAFRVERADAPVSELGDLNALLVHQFLASVTAYASQGRNFLYTVKRQTGSLVGGRIDITKSVQLWARGLRHLLVFDKNMVTYNTPVNRIVLAALREVERLSRLVRIRQDDVVRARGLAMLFADCRDSEILFGRRAAFVDQAHALLNAPLPGPVRDTVALASVVLAHESFEHSSEHPAAVPRTWFLNLEALFETAVRNVLAEKLRPIRRISRGGDHSRQVFARVTGEYTAHPDLVVSGAGGIEAVGDVKYKTWDGSAASGDVYQLLVHAAAFECRHAFLVFPSDRFEVRHLGCSATGCDVKFFTVDVRNLHRDAESLVEELGLSARHATVSSEGSVKDPSVS